MALCLFCNTGSSETSPENVELHFLQEDSGKQLCAIFCLEESKYLQELQLQQCCDDCWKIINLAKIYEEQIRHIQKSINEVRYKLETHLKSSFFHSLQSDADIAQQDLRESLLTDLHVIIKIPAPKQECVNFRISEDVILEDYGVEEIVATAANSTQEVSQERGETAGTDTENIVTEFTFRAIDDGNTIVDSASVVAACDAPTDTDSVTNFSAVQEIGYEIPITDTDDVVLVQEQAADIPAEVASQGPEASSSVDLTAASVTVEVKMLSQEEVEKWTSGNPEDRKQLEQQYKKEEQIRKLRTRKKLKSRTTAVKRVGGVGIDCPYSNCISKFPTNMGLKEHVRRVHTRPEYISADKKPVEGTGIEIEVGNFFSDIQEAKNKFIVCSYDNCFARYRRMMGLRQHIRLAHEAQTGEPFRCKEENCVASFSTYRGLEIHIRKSHLNVPAFLCKCGEAYKTRAEYRDHAKDAHNLFECLACLQEFATRSELRKHRGQAHPRDALRRMKIPATGSEEPDADQTFRNACERRVPGGLDGTDTVMYVCPHCPKTTDAWNKMQDHLVTHGEKRHKCDQCEAKFYYLSKLKRHMLKHTQIRNHMCHACGKAFLTSTELIMHQKKHCPGLRTEATTKPYECSLCFKRYQDSCTLDRHMKEHAGIKTKKDKPLQKCDRCDYETNNPTLLKYHKVTHEGTFNSPCTQCDRKFRFPRQLKWHIRLVHENVGRYECDQCNYKTNQKQPYVDHMNVHTNESPHICEKCGKKYRRLNHLRRHQQEKHGRMPTDVHRSTGIKRAVEQKRRVKIAEQEVAEAVAEIDGPRLDD